VGALVQRRRWRLGLLMQGPGFPSLIPTSSLPIQGLDGQACLIAPRIQLQWASAPPGMADEVSSSGNESYGAYICLEALATNALEVRLSSRAPSETSATRYTNVERHLASARLAQPSGTAAIRKRACLTSSKDLRLLTPECACFRNPVNQSHKQPRLTSTPYKRLF
jgi:hypothetical protein